ncbi:MAG: hypothetical protein ABJG78_14760 [Cyclobacteriaceae bacterium]
MKTIISFFLVLLINGFAFSQSQSNSYNLMRSIELIGNSLDRLESEFDLDEKLSKKELVERLNDIDEDYQSKLSKLRGGYEVLVSNYKILADAREKKMGSIVSFTSLIEHLSKIAFNLEVNSDDEILKEIIRNEIRKIDYLLEKNGVNDPKLFVVVERLRNTDLVRDKVYKNDMVNELKLLVREFQDALHSLSIELLTDFQETNRFLEKIEY